MYQKYRQNICSFILDIFGLHVMGNLGIMSYDLEIMDSSRIKNLL